MQRMNDRVQKFVVILKTPIDAAIEEIDKFLKEGKEFGEYDFLDLVNAVISKNAHVKAYFDIISSYFHNNKKEQYNSC